MPMDKGIGVGYMLVGHVTHFSRCCKKRNGILRDCQEKVVPSHPFSE